MANIEVKNLGGTTTPACTCKTFLCHWENYSGKKANICSVLGCPETNNLIGGHVIKCHGNADSDRYIVPLCKSCNSIESSKCFKLKEGTILVPVIERSKCKPCN